MGSNIPIALLGRPPEITDPQTIQMNAERIRALSGQNALQPGQQVMQQQQIQQNQNELKQQQLQLQQAATVLQGNQAIVSAQHDPTWNPSDPDNVVKLFKQYNVPLPLQGQAMKVITDMKTQMMGASKEALSMAQQAHSYMDDQIEAAKSAPPDSQQKAYQQSLDNVRSYYAQFPDGQAKTMAMQEIASAPPLYDRQWIDQQHAHLKTQASLIEDSLKQAQTAEAQGKGFQAQQEGNLFGAKIPGAQAESTIQQQQAGMDPQERALAGNLFYGAAGGDPQARKALQLETSQKIAAAQAGVAGSNSALRGVPPHLVPAATADATKVGQEFMDATAAARDMKTFVDLAKSGNKIAYAYSPTEGVLTLNTARGVKRVNMAEIGSYSGAGSAQDRIMAFLGKQTSGASIPDDVLNDMATLHQSIAANAQQTYGSKLKVINQNYGSSFQPVDTSSPPSLLGSTAASGTSGPPAGATHTVLNRADGKMHWTDAQNSKDYGVAQ
jgi:hypothetical protein